MLDVVPIASLPDEVALFAPLVVLMMRRMQKTEPTAADDLVCALINDKLIFISREEFLASQSGAEPLPPAWSEEPVTEKGKSIWILYSTPDNVGRCIRLMDRNFPTDELEVVCIHHHMINAWHGLPHNTADALEIFPLNPLFKQSLFIDTKSWDFLCEKFGIEPTNVFPARAARSMALTSEGLILTVVTGSSVRAEAVYSFLFDRKAVDELFGDSFKAALDCSIKEDTLITQEHALTYWREFSKSHTLRCRFASLIESPTGTLSPGGDA